MPTLNWIGKEAVVNHHRTVPFRKCVSLTLWDEERQKLIGFDAVSV